MITRWQISLRKYFQLGARYILCSFDSWHQSNGYKAIFFTVPNGTTNLEWLDAAKPFALHW